MGQLRFLVPSGQEQTADCLASCGYLTGFDGVPSRSGRRREGATLVVERAECDSARLQVLWNVPGHGPLVLSTATLMERTRPYYLPVELARGTICRVREFRAALEAQQVPLPPEADEHLHLAQARLAAAGCCETFAPNAGEQAQEAIVRAVAAGEAFAAAAAAQRRLGSRPPVLAFGLDDRLPEPDQAVLLRATFDTAVVSFNWPRLEPRPDQFDWSSVERQLDWCAAHGFALCGGPLVRLEEAALPGWLTERGRPIPDWVERIECYVAEAVSRFRDRVPAWKAVGRTAHLSDVGGLGEEQKLRLAVRAFEVARHTARETSPVSVVFDQPWGEFITWRPARVSPLYFADALVRADLGISALELEINLGYHPGGTWPRDRVELERHLDRWACLGLPLAVTLVVPSNDDLDPRAQRPAEVIDLDPAGGASPEAQARWVRRLAETLAARGDVQAVCYGQLADATEHEWPWGGLFDLEGRPKPALEALAAIGRRASTPAA